VKQENYWVLGIIGIIFLVALVLVFRENLPFRNTNTIETIVISPTTVQVKGTTNSKPETKSQTPKMQIDTNKQYEATLKTEKGDIVIELNAKKTPITVNNFVSLSKKDFYNNTIFHRVIKGFMIQGGDPQGTGMGGPGYKFDDEPIVGEYTRGTVAMANSGPNTNGSQFFIMHKDNPLPKNYVIFGKVTKGMDVVDTLAESDVSAGLSGENSTPVKPVKILSVSIVEK